MKRIICSSLLAAGFLAGLGAADAYCGVSASMDAALFTLGFSPVRGLVLSASAGPAWERRADLRVNDSEIRCSLRYAPWPDGKWIPYAAAGYELFIVDTSYSGTAAHGVLMGVGLEYRFRRDTAVHFQGGWRYGRGIVREEYAGPAASVFRDETWRAPPFWMELGLRLYPGG